MTAAWAAGIVQQIADCDCGTNDACMYAAPPGYTAVVNWIDIADKVSLSQLAVADCCLLVTAMHSSRAGCNVQFTSTIVLLDYLSSARNSVIKYGSVEYLHVGSC